MTVELDITPGVSILGVLSHLNYEPWYALAEYVDNALQSSVVEREAIEAVEPEFHLSVDLDIRTEGSGQITVVDNAGGIRIDDFARAFRAAEVPPDRSGLSEFGMGMKSASIWFAKKWSVETTSVGDPNIYKVVFDMTDVLEEQSSVLAVDTTPGQPESHFTRIVLTDLNQVPRGRTLGKIRDHMRDIYRNFLRSGELRLVVSGERLSYAEPHVLIAVDARAEDGMLGGQQAEAVEWWKAVDIQLHGGARVHGFAALRDEGSTRDAGFSLFRRGRVIVGSGDEPYRPVAIYGRGNSYRSQRLFGELNVEGLAVSHTKDGFQWGDQEEELLEALRTQLDSEPLPLLKQAENYRSRTVTRQQAKFISDATESTARSVEVHLPDVDLADIEPEPQASLPDNTTEPDPHATRDVEFELEGQTWKVSVRAAQDPEAVRWVTRRIDRTSPDTVEIQLTLNAGHPFVKQFALGDRDSFEAVLRIATAMVVAESLIQDAGLEYAGLIQSYVNTVLTQALSTRT